MGRLEKMKSIIIEEANKRILNEETDKEVSGPYGKPPSQYYIFQKGSKFYIYRTSNSQKEPKLTDGGLWDNYGKGYDTENDAIEIVKKDLEELGELGDFGSVEPTQNNTEYMDMGDDMGEPIEGPDVEVDL